VPDSSALLGHRIGNYVVTSLLGQGGMGEVYLAEHPKIGRQVAIKVLASHLLSTAQLASRILIEAQAVARINQPNVIDIYDFGNLSCRVKLQERELPLSTAPCRFQAADGQLVWLEGLRPGFISLIKQWIARGDREIVVEVRQAERRIAQPKAASASTAIGAHQPAPAGLRPNPIRAARKTATGAGATESSVAAPPATPPHKPTPKVEPKHIGEGTMEMPD
jgi:hypothetical protein